MNNNVPVQKNEDYIIDIERMGYEGEGVGKYQGFTVFVQGTLPGEKVRAKIVKISKNFCFGKLLEIITPSKNRETPICDIYKRCGGCQLQHLNYISQLEFKHERVKDCIERIGKLKNITIHPTLGREDNNLRYRNKVQLPVGMKNGEAVIGFYAPRSHEIIDMSKCYIQDEVGDKASEILKKWIKKYDISVYDESTGKGLIRTLMIRRGFKTGEIMIVIVTNGSTLPETNTLIDMFNSEIHGIKSIIQNVNKKDTNVVLGEECITLWGSSYITDFIGEFKFKISPLSFFQVNPYQTEILYKKALEYADLNGNETVFDAYCGTGTISLFLSQKAKKVYGVEIIPQAIENAKENAKYNNVDNVEFFTGEAEQVIPELIDSGIKADVVVVDPPRKGCEASLLNAIAQMAPSKIVYVSCDPGTLARDLNILDGLGYRTMEVQPVDMFPQTAHVETVVLITRVEK